MTTRPSDAETFTISRREAIRRAALVLGAGMTPSLVRGALEQKPTAAAGDAPVYLTVQHFALVAALAETIIPRTETPGAFDVGVPQFIDVLYGEFLTEEETKTLTDGLDRFGASCEATQGKPYEDLEPEQRSAFLAGAVEAPAGDERKFHRLVRELTILGYFTSREVGTSVLHYDPVPGRFDGCIPIEEVGNVNWTV